MSIAIDRAEAVDLEVLLALMRKMQLEDPWSEPFNEAAVRQSLHELLLSQVYGVAYLVREAEAVVAYLIVCFDFSIEYCGKGAWIDELFVALSHRGRGIGTQLLDLAESASRELGALYLHLEVSHGNRAIDLYRRRGFVNHPRYLMTKSLRSGA
jgi:GNAT superfamily N-acetyltransferase